MASPVVSLTCTFVKKWAMCNSDYFIQTCLTLVLFTSRCCSLFLTPPSSVQVFCFKNRDETSDTTKGDSSNADGKKYFNQWIHRQIFKNKTCDLFPFFDYMKKYAVIVAGGSGTRMGYNMPKQFLLIKGKPVLWYTIDAFLRAFDDIAIILVLPEIHFAKGRGIIAQFNHTDKIVLVNGGNTRYGSVKNGLQLVKEASVVFVHDGVRCLISVPLIQRCFNQALLKGSAVPAVSATDSIRIFSNGKHAVADRQQVRVIQTPQTFLSSIILPAFEQEYDETFTDEATVVEAYGTEVFLTEGEYDNIKITRPVDLMIAERMIEERSAL